MRAKEIILATTLLTGGCSVPQPDKPDRKTEIQQPPQVKGYETSFKIPEEIHALEEESKKRIAQALDCDGSILYKVESGAFHQHDIPTDQEVVFLSDNLQCISDEVSVCVNVCLQYSVCVNVCLQYKEGTMVNGFTISGICVPSEYYEGIVQSQPNLSDSVDLSKTVGERKVFFTANYI